MKLAHLHILQHALGADQYGRKADTVPASDPFKHHGFHRSHFVTGLDTQDGRDCQDLAALGYLEDLGYQRAFGGHIFTVTRAGVEAMHEHSPRPPRQTRAQRRYAYYREIGDLFPDGFRDFLRFLQDPENRYRLPPGV